MLKIERLVLALVIMAAGAQALEPVGNVTANAGLLEAKFDPEKINVSEFWANETANVTCDMVIFSENWTEVMVVSHSFAPDLIPGNVTIELFGWIVQPGTPVADVLRYNLTPDECWAQGSCIGIGPKIDWPERGIINGIALYEDGEMVELIEIQPGVSRASLATFFDAHPEFANDRTGVGEVVYRRLGDGAGRWARVTGYLERCPSRDCSW